MGARRRGVATVLLACALAPFSAAVGLAPTETVGTDEGVVVPYGGSVTRALPDGWTVVGCPVGAAPNLVDVTCDDSSVTFTAQGYDPGQGVQDVEVAAEFRAARQRLVYEVALGAPGVRGPAGGLYGYPVAQGTGITIPFAEIVAGCDACTETLPTYTGATLEPAEAGSAAFTGLGLALRVSPTFTGDATVVFRVRDRHGQESEPTELRVRVVPAGGTSVPVTVAREVRADVGQEVDGDVLAGVPAVERDGVSVTSCGPALNGTVSCDPDGSFVYAPRDGFTGVDQFAYHLTTADGNHAVGSVVVGVGADPAGALDVRERAEVTPVLTPPAPLTGQERTDGAGIFGALRDALARVHGAAEPAP